MSVLDGKEVQGQNLGEGEARIRRVYGGWGGEEHTLKEHFGGLLLP